MPFNSATPLKGKWRENVLNCRKCKRYLVIFLGQYLLDHIGPHLTANQKLYVAGSFEGDSSDIAWFVQGHQSPQPDPPYNCNAEETDTRIWLHSKQTNATRIFIMSPDTDVFCIGLSLESIKPKEIIIQISPLNSRELRLLHLNRLVHALQCDPDLVALPSQIVPQVLQTLYVTTGCDYISFFSGIGKATFLRYFFNYASFISANETAKGTLADVSLTGDTYRAGFLSFLRLIGTVYFKKHNTGFDIPSPVTHYNKFLECHSTTLTIHANWLEDIRQNIWDRISFENDMMPSLDVLWRHWLRSCWVIDVATSRC